MDFFFFPEYFTSVVFSRVERNKMFFVLNIIINDFEKKINRFIYLFGKHAFFFFYKPFNVYIYIRIAGIIVITKCVCVCVCSTPFLRYWCRRGKKVKSPSVDIIDSRALCVRHASTTTYFIKKNI